MSVAKDQKQAAREKKSGRGSTDNKRRLDAFAKVSPSSGADWGACDSKWIQSVVVAITELGGALTFGMSRDKGAHSLTLMLDGSRETLWFNAGANLDAELHEVYEKLDALH